MPRRCLLHRKVLGAAAERKLLHLEIDPANHPPSLNINWARRSARQSIVRRDRIEVFLDVVCGEGPERGSQT